MEVFKILAVCLITAILAIVLKEHRGDYALVLVLAGGVTVTCYVLKSIVGPIGCLKQLLYDNGIKKAEVIVKWFKELQIIFPK